MSVQTFGLAAFRAAIQRNLELAEFAETAVRGHAGLTVMAPATLGIVCFRREWPACDEAETERRGIALIDALERTGAALVSSTRLAGRHAIRLCVLNPTSTEDYVRRVVEHFATAPFPPACCGALVAADPRADVVADPDKDVLRTMPLLWGVPDSTIRAVRARAARLDVAADAGFACADGLPTGRSTSSSLAAMTSSLTPGRSAPSAPVTTSANSPPVTGEAATATPAWQPSGAPNLAASSSSPAQTFNG